MCLCLCLSLTHTHTHTHIQAGRGGVDALGGCHGITGASSTVAGELEGRQGWGRDAQGWQSEAVALHQGYDFAIAFENKVESGYVCRGWWLCVGEMT